MSQITFAPFSQEGREAGWQVGENFRREVEAYMEFKDRGWGDFHCGYVHGHIDYKPTTRDGEPAIEWTWDGNAEMDPAQGRGWAVVKDNELHGMIFFHGGDDSEFVAQRATGKMATKRK